jgi:hypothetical protein
MRYARRVERKLDEDSAPEVTAFQSVAESTLR